MRPLLLKLQGFGPYKEEQTLELSGLELFAITGPTGAGKSTILDALVFALYGDIPRLGGRDYKDAIALGCASMVVCLDFELEKKVYRVTRRGRRAGSAIAELEEVKAAGPVALATGVREVNARVAQLLGVDAVAFLQSVVLPQNEFARFLVSEPSKRRVILTELFGLGLYERMRGLASGRARDAKVLRDEIDRQLGGRRAVSAAEVTLLEAEAELAANRAAELGAQVSALESTLPGLRERATWTRELRGCEASLRRLEEDEGRIESDERRLEAHRHAAPLVPLLDQKARVSERLGAAEEALSIATRRCEILAPEVDAAQVAVNQASSAALALPELRGREMLLRTLAATVESLQAMEVVVTRHATSLAEKARIVEERRSAHAQAAADVESLVAARASLQAKLGSIEFDAAEWERLEGLRAEARMLGERRVALAVAVADAGKLRAQAREDAGVAEAARAAALKAEAAWRAAGDASRALAEELATAERHEGALHLRESLHAGDACPVCTQKVEIVPAAEIPPELASLRVKVAGAASALQDLADALAAAEKEAQTAEVAAQVSHRTAADSEERASDARAAVDESTLRLLEIFGFGEELVEARIGARLEVLSAARSAAAEASEAVASATLRLELRTVELKNAGASRAEAEQRQSEVAAELELAQGSREELRARIHAETKGEDPGSLLLGIARRIGELEAAVKTAEAALGQAIRALSEAEASRQASAASLQALAGEQAGLVAQVEGALSARGFVDADGLRRAVLEDAVEEALRAQVEEHRRDAALHRQRVGELLPRLGDVRVEESEVNAGELRLKTLRIESASSQRSAVEKANAAANAARDLSELLRLREERNRHDVNYQTQEFLQTHLQGSRFQNYVLEESFAELTEGASHRLKRLSGRYTLRPAEGCGFLVVDHDNAEETRPADTLSGGETFLASLALAMELSAQVQRAAGGPTLDSIFIDEGFGTLDPESLDVVAEAIEALPAEGRMVGIVTHVEALAERLPDRVVVEKAEGGSVIRRGA